jgi:DNA-binding beta-propeller fold protein YncE
MWVAIAGDGFGAGGTLPLRVVHELPLAGHSPRFDYQTIDQSTRMLYISHQGDGTIVAVDLDRLRVTATILRVPGVHGVLAVPALHRLYASAQTTHQLVVIDTRTHRAIARTPAGRVPDGIAYDPVDHEVFVSDERPDGAITAATASTGRLLARIPLGGSAGNVQYDPTRRQILVDVETHDEIAVVDPRARRVVRQVRIVGCAANHSLLVDAAAHLLVIGCAANGRLIVLDDHTFREVGHVDHAGHLDVLALDALSAA